MEYARLGRTELEVSRLGFGTAPLGELFGAVDEFAAIAVVHEALDLGISFFDTAAYYGNAEERLGKALVGRRDRVVLGTKTGRYGVNDFDFSPGRIRRSVENSLRLLKTDYVDILQFHDIEFVPLDPVFEDSYAELRAMRDEGLCRYIGMTGYPAPVMNAAMTRDRAGRLPDLCSRHALGRHAGTRDCASCRRSGRRPHQRSRGRARPAHAGRLIDQARPPRNPRRSAMRRPGWSRCAQSGASTSPSSPTSTPYSARGALPP